MTEWLIAKNIWAAWLGRPTTWMLAASALAFARWLERWLPLGLTTEDLQRLSAHYEIAFIAGILGASAAAMEMRPYAALTRKLAPLRRVALEAIVLVLPATLCALAVLVPAHLLKTWQLGAFDARAAMGGMALGWLHFCLMATLVLRGAPRPEGGPPRAQTMALLASLCVLVLAGPGLLDGHGQLASGFGVMLDVGAPLRASFASEALQASSDLGTDRIGDPASWVRVLPIVTFGLLSVALVSPHTPRQTPPHALRDPR